jgi:hypothetical protein
VLHPVGATHQFSDETIESNHPAQEQSISSNDGSPLLQTPHRSGPIPNSLGAMIGQFKSRATKRIWSLPEMDHSPIWQRNYYDHIIRDEQEFRNIWNYIETNPLKWQEDQLHPSVINKGASSPAEGNRTKIVQVPAGLVAPQQINQE